MRVLTDVIRYCYELNIYMVVIIDMGKIEDYRYYLVCKYQGLLEYNMLCFTNCLIHVALRTSIYLEQHVKLTSVLPYVISIIVKKINVEGHLI